MERLWNISVEDFWKPTNVDGFWSNLPKMAGADELVEWVCEKFTPDNVCILTSPSSDMRCIPEKREWMAKNYPHLAQNMLFGSAKRFLAGDGRVLIDDRDKNIDSFNKAGGRGVVYPQLWNCMWTYEGAPISFVKDMLTI
jgi:5'(3')-deoxyribonucleotidase